MTAPIASLEAQVNDLMTQYGADSGRLKVNTAYYDANYRPKAIGMAVPPPMKKLMAKMGWARTYVGAIEERLDVTGFRMVGEDGSGKPDKRLWQWWQSNKMDVESGLAHTEALIHGRCYVTIAMPDTSDPLSDNESPIIKVESPHDVYAEINPLNGRVERAIRVYEVPNPVGAKVRAVTLYLKNSTHYLWETQNGWSEMMPPVVHDMGVVPVVPLLNKERIKQSRGVTEIKDELRSTIDAASRLLMNLQATAELMAVPQRVLFGLEESEIAKIEGKSAWEAYLANILAFTDPSGSIAQFAAAELRNFAEGMKVLREEASTITGLGPQYFHFGMDNPASAEAMQASEVRLVKKAERKCKIFGEAWETVMRICILMKDGKLPKEAFRMETIWADPATPTYAAKADAASKALASTSADGRSLVPLEQLRIDLGYSPETRQEMEGWDDKAKRLASKLVDLYGPQNLRTGGSGAGASSPAGSPPKPSAPKPQSPQGGASQ